MFLQRRLYILDKTNELNHSGDKYIIYKKEERWKLKGKNKLGSKNVGI
jgi:hypothetical protein